MPVPSPNGFLSHLPAALRSRLVAACTRVELRLAEVLSEPGHHLGYVYFPCGSYISQTIRLEGREVEVGLVGDEGTQPVLAPRPRSRAAGPHARP